MPKIIHVADGVLYPSNGVHRKAVAGCGRRVTNWAHRIDALALVATGEYRLCRDCR